MLGVNQNNKLYAQTIRASKGIQIGHKHNPNKDVLNTYSSWRRLDLVPEQDVIDFEDKGTYIRRDGDMATLSFNFEIRPVGDISLVSLIPLTPITHYLAATGTVYSNTLRMKNEAGVISTGIAGRVFIDPAVSQSKLFLETDGLLESGTPRAWTINGHITYRVV